MCLFKKNLPFVIPKNGALALYDANGNEIFGVLKCVLKTERKEIGRLDAEILVNVVGTEKEMMEYINKSKCESY